MRTSTWSMKVAMVAAAAVTTLVVAGCSDSSGGGSPEGEPAGIEELNIIVPADTGGGWDQTGRAMKMALEGEGILDEAEVQNVPGAGGTSGLASLATETNPNTLMVMGYVMVGAIATNGASVTLADTTPIARLTEEPLIVVVPPDSPYQDINDLIEDIQENGQAVSVAGGSAGGADHILAAQMLTASGTPAAEVAGLLNYIPYSGGGESLAALLGGNVSAGISGVGEYAPQVEAGQLRALAVSGPEASNAVPDVPTLIDSGVDLSLTNWRGVVASGQIDDAQAQALTDLVTELHATQQWQDLLAENDWADAFLAGPEFASYLESEVTAVEQTLRDIGLVAT